jgi:thymidylate kinase
MSDPDIAGKRMRAHPHSKSTLLVSFSGIDGAGKSTQIANLCAFLGTSSLRVELITFWDDVAMLKPIREGAGHKIFKGDKGVGSPDAPIERRDKNVRSPLMTLVRMGLYLLDAISLRGRARRALRSGADVVIFDRYIYDELANLNLDNPVMRAYLRALMTLAPKPDVAFVLDADPEQARARKPEYPLDFLHINRNAYLRLSRYLDGIAVIPPLPISQAKLAVVRQVLCRLPAQESGSGTMAAPVEAIPAPQPKPQNELDGQEARPIAS